MTPHQHPLNTVLALFFLGLFPFSSAFADEPQAPQQQAQRETASQAQPSASPQAETPAQPSAQTPAQPQSPAQEPAQAQQAPAPAQPPAPVQIPAPAQPPASVQASAPEQPPAQAAAPLKTMEFDRIEGQKIYFKGPGDATKTVKTRLHSLSYLGLLNHPERPQPFFLFTGRPCESCAQETGVYAINPQVGRIEAFVYPGRINDSKTGNVVYQSRAFFGRCLPRVKNDAYVVYQKEVVDRRRGLQSSVYVAEPGEADFLEERLIERRLPRIQDTLHYVKKKTCREIEGRNRVMINKPLDLTLRKAEEENEAAAPSENP